MKISLSAESGGMRRSTERLQATDPGVRAQHCSSMLRAAGRPSQELLCGAAAAEAARRSDPPMGERADLGGVHAPMSRRRVQRALT